MLIKCDRFARFQCPAACATAGTIETITRANFVKIFCGMFRALENDSGHWEAVRIFDIGIPGKIPQAKNNVQVLGELAEGVDIIVYDFVLFSKGKDLTMGVIFRGDYHFFEVCRIGDIAGNMETEKSAPHDSAAYLPPVIIPITVKDIQIALVGIADGRT